MSLQDKINNAKETPWLCYYRPKKKIAYEFGTYGSAFTMIACHPRSKWLCINADDSSVQLANRNVYITIPTEEFEEMWVEWKKR